MEGERRFELSKEHTLESQWEQGGYLFHFGSEQGLPTDMDIETQVLDLEAESGGSAERTAIVLGGVGEDVVVMKPFLLELAKQGVQVVGVSLPSYGDSSDADRRWRVAEDGTDKTTFADYEAVIDAVRNQLSGDDHPKTTRPIAGQVELVGHSLGGAIMAEYAAHHTDSINTVHLVAPAGRKKYEPAPGIRIAPELLWETIQMHFKERIPQTLKSIVDNKEIPPVMQHMWIKNLLKNGGAINTLQDLESHTLEPRVIQRFWEGMVAGQGRLDEHLATLRAEDIPTTVYASQKDELFPPDAFTGIEDHGAELAVLADLAHYGILDDSTTVVSEIMKHMNA